MSELPSRRCWVALAIVAWLLSSHPDGFGEEAGRSDRAGQDYFEQHIRPVLIQECYGCHSADAPDLKAGLRLDGRTGWMEGGDSGPAVDTSSPSASLLLKALRHEADVSSMPPDRDRLSDDILAHFEHWIGLGAPGGDDLPADAGRPSEEANHWAFQPPVPSVSPSSTRRVVQSKIDTWIEQKLTERGLQFSPPAGQTTLVRRLYLDLLGLPPTYDQMRSVTRSTDPLAFEQLVDQLLASPQFGERWGRFWLDVARYADTKGYLFTEDRNYPEAYRYREWVIRSLNSDRPYDEFVEYQLAADQVASDSSELAAMGFLTLGRRFLNNRHDIIDDRIDVVSRGLLGLTVGCARCHSHKFDPIPIEDYYSLYGVFASSEEPGGEPSALRLVDRPEPVTPVVFIRGNPDRPGEAVPRQFLQILSGPERKPFEQGSGRLELARSISSPQNPLTARVLVNRVWGRLMGQYLVDTPSDFGVRSPRPDYLEVLDHLAVEFMRHDWSIKWLVREIVSSATYRQSSLGSDELMAVDPSNTRYGRMNRRRLDFEGLRDSMLRVSGLLRAESMGGPSVNITEGDAPPRRTIYAFIDRQNVPGLFRVFDVASSDTHSPKRYETTVPQQALYLLNSPFVWKATEQIAQQVGESGHSTIDRIQWLYQQILARDPTEVEERRAVEFLESGKSEDVPVERWQELAQALMICNEFVYVD